MESQWEFVGISWAGFFFIICTSKRKWTLLRQHFQGRFTWDLSQEETQQSWFPKTQPASGCPWQLCMHFLLMLVLLGFRGSIFISLCLEGLQQQQLNIAERRPLQNTYLEKDSSHIVLINLRIISQFVIIIHCLHWLKNFVPSPAYRN